MSLELHALSQVCEIGILLAILYVHFRVKMNLYNFMFKILPLYFSWYYS